MAGDAEKICGLADENRHLRSDDGEHRLQIAFGCGADEHRSHGPPAVLDQPRDDDAAFGDEKIPRMEELRVGDTAVVGHARIAGRLDSIERHHPS